ncbi:mediator of RNA polymerase II transcription subunit 15-like [Neocloeon triangulifer]|uniref:mediator of RNA polymerase II transcription subunit 15-like n=1 Tax=Neocloeon triangulifer TaxID=2078957 RepID=UPI00286F9D10|nr:mediator of RNA polymerase II transcription subunit 15-like [Neocloeon triangulifer]
MAGGEVLFIKFTKQIGEMAANEDNSWKTPVFRQIVVTKIQTEVQNCGMPMSRSSMEVESHIFQKAKTKDEYLGFIARLFLHLRKNYRKKGTGTGGATIGQGVRQHIADQINALQTFARQGANPDMVAGMSAGPAAQMQKMQGQVVQQGQQIPPEKCEPGSSTPNSPRKQYSDDDDSDSSDDCLKDLWDEALREARLASNLSDDLSKSQEFSQR